MKTAAQRVAGLLRDVTATGSDRARGTFGDHVVELRLVDRGVGSSRDPYTEIWFVGVKLRPDLRLHVIPQRIEDAMEVGEGRGTDVVVGDRAFDDAFFVEAAPSEIVVRVLEPGLRAQMLAARPLALHTHEGGLLVEAAGWERPVRPLVEIGATVAAAVPLAFEDADRDGAMRAGYRGMVSLETRDQTRRDEVQAVLTRKKAREERRATLGCIAMLAFLAALVLFVVLYQAAGGFQSVDP